jgi:hypothetical protein
MSTLETAEKRLRQATTALESAIESNRAALGQADPATAAASPEKAAKKPPGSNRGIETMFRNIYRVQMDLTGLADNKANMMISINGIIISIIIAAVAPKLDSNPWLMIPTTLLLLGTMVSLVYSIQAARPRVSHQSITLGDLRHSEGNLLFFGNFAYLRESEFLEGMGELMGDREAIYEAMIRDIHGIGSVLNKKFHLLQKAYWVFMVALVAGVLAFLGVFAWIMAQA